MSRFPMPFRKALERDIHDAIHPGGQHVGMARVTLEASRAQRLLVIVDELERENAALREAIAVAWRELAKEPLPSGWVLNAIEALERQQPPSDGPSAWRPCAACRTPKLCIGTGCSPPPARSNGQEAKP